jgi:hypothetical protein
MLLITFGGVFAFIVADYMNNNYVQKLKSVEPKKDAIYKPPEDISEEEWLQSGLTKNELSSRNKHRMTFDDDNTDEEG